MHCRCNNFSAEMAQTHVAQFGHAATVQLN